jgi:hypothetical protein
VLTLYAIQLPSGEMRGPLTVAMRYRSSGVTGRDSAGVAQAAHSSAARVRNFRIC